MDGELAFPAGFPAGQGQDFGQTVDPLPADTGDQQID